MYKQERQPQTTIPGAPLLCPTLLATVRLPPLNWLLLAELLGCPRHNLEKCSLSLLRHRTSLSHGGASTAALAFWQVL